MLTIESSRTPGLGTAASSNRLLIVDDADVSLQYNLVQMPFLCSGSRHLYPRTGQLHIWDRPKSTLEFYTYIHILRILHLHVAIPHQSNHRLCHYLINVLKYHI